MEKEKESIMLNIEDESQDYVGHIIIHESPESSVTTPRASPPEPTDAMSDNDSTSDDSAYHASTICDSPTSTTSTLDLNPAEHSNDETLVGEASGEASSQCNESHGIIENFDEAGTLFSPRYKPISNPNEFQLTRTRDRNVILFGAAMKGLKFKPLILGGRFNRDSDSDSDSSDMPPLEETKKNKEDFDEDSDYMPPTI